jgi:hypothetical protein
LPPFDTSQAESILARFPGPVTLHIKRRRKFVAFALCLGLTLCFAWAVFVAASDSDGWIGFALFLALFAALTVRAAILMLVPGIGSLTLGADGFSMEYILRTARTSWPDVVSDFRDETMRRARGRMRVVAFEVAIASVWGRTPTTATRMLPDNFELTLDELAWLLNEWRRRALAQAASEGPGATGRVSKFGRQPINET